MYPFVDPFSTALLSTCLNMALTPKHLPPKRDCSPIPFRTTAVPFQNWNGLSPNRDCSLLLVRGCSREGVKYVAIYAHSHVGTGRVTEACIIRVGRDQCQAGDARALQPTTHTNKIRKRCAYVLHTKPLFLPVDIHSTSVRADPLILL